MFFDHPNFTSLAAKYAPEDIVGHLSPLLTQKRIERIEAVLKERVPHVQIAIEAPADVHNALAVVRTAEAMGVAGVHIVAPEMKRRSGKRTTMGTSRWMDIVYHKAFSDFVSNVKDAGYSLAGAIVDSITPLDKIELDKPICLLFGNENRGLSDEAIESCEQHFTIPMCGMVESFNLSVAAGISLYDVMRRLKGTYKLSESDFIKEKAYYIVKTVGYDIAKKILAKELN